jgi:stage V sporulation protein B
LKRKANNTLILTITNVFNRTVGFAFRIALIRIAGREAVGLWQMIMPLYFFFLVLASAGLPTAVSRSVAEHRARGDMDGVQRVFKTALSFAVVSGLTAAIILSLFAGFFSQHILTDARVKLTLLIIAPSLPLVAVSAVFRGYFQGLEVMPVVATSLIFEEIVHIAATISLVGVTLSKGPGLLAAGFAAGSLLSEVAGLGVYLVAFPLFKSSSRRQNGFSLPLLISILRLSVPATASRLLYSIGQLCQSIIIPTRLRVAGWTASQAAIAYGELTGMALNLLFMPSLFTVAMATTLLPKVTAAIARSHAEQAQAIFLQAISWTALISLPLSAMMISLGKPICQLLFGSSSAGDLLTYLAWGGLLLYTQQVAGATLQGLGKPLLPLITSAIGTAISSVLLYAFTAVWQIEGVAFGLIASWTTTGVISLYLVQRWLPFFDQFWPRLLKITVAAALSGMAAHNVYLHCLANSGRMLLSLLCAGIGACLIYLIAAAGVIRQQFANR